MLGTDNSSPNNPSLLPPPPKPFLDTIELNTTGKAREELGHQDKRTPSRLAGWLRDQTEGLRRRDRRANKAKEEERPNRVARGGVSRAVKFIGGRSSQCGGPEPAVDEIPQQRAGGAAPHQKGIGTAGKYTREVK